jgi:hypothetical protein
LRTSKKKSDVEIVTIQSCRYQNYGCSSIVYIQVTNNCSAIEQCVENEYDKQNYRTPNNLTHNCLRSNEKEIVFKIGNKYHCSIDLHKFEEHKILKQLLESNGQKWMKKVFILIFYSYVALSRDKHKINFTNFNKMNNYQSPQLTGHKQTDHYMLFMKSSFSLRGSNLFTAHYFNLLNIYLL